MHAQRPRSRGLLRFGPLAATRRPRSQTPLSAGCQWPRPAGLKQRPPPRNVAAGPSLGKGSPAQASWDMCCVSMLCPKSKRELYEVAERARCKRMVAAVLALLLRCLLDVSGRVARCLRGVRHVRHSLPLRGTSAERPHRQTLLAVMLVQNPAGAPNQAFNGCDAVPFQPLCARLAVHQRQRTTRNRKLGTSVRGRIARQG